LQPGKVKGTTEFVSQGATRADPRATPAALKAILPYFSPAGVKRNAEADLRSAFSADRTGCCADTKRKAVSVTTDAATSFIKTTVGGKFAGWVPMVNATSGWDHHWYRKDAQRSWSHKRGHLDAQQDDSAGTNPICNPCFAARKYVGKSVTIDYTNVVGSWCLT